MIDSHVRLAHGNGGRLMRELLETRVYPALGVRESATDAAPVAARPGWLPYLSSDSFTVQPLFFPGGDIGSLAVHGTLNDLAVSGAEPAALTLNLVLEEGFPLADLEQILASAGRAARAAGVPVVGGDTKVVPHGQGSGVVIATTGLGWRDPALSLDIHAVRPGDAVLVSGPLGDHGTAVMLAREQFGLQSELVSDAGCVLELARLAWGLPGVRFLRDPTRGGLASVMHEIARASGLGANLEEAAIPLRDPVRGACSLLGFNPLQLASEGRMVAIAAPEIADILLRRWQAHPLGCDAARIGYLTSGSEVCLATPLGGRRWLEELAEDPLPRIC